MSPTNRTDPLLAGNFVVEIPGIISTAFSEVSGLDASIDVGDYRAGDDPESAPKKLQGLRKFTDITLKRGFTSDLSLWAWFQNGLTGSVARVDMTIALRDQNDVPVLGVEGEERVAVQMEWPRAFGKFERRGHRNAGDLPRRD